MLHVRVKRLDSPDLWKDTNSHIFYATDTCYLLSNQTQNLTHLEFLLRPPSPQIADLLDLKLGKVTEPQSFI